MDDYSMNTLTGGKQEWALELVQVLSPVILDGINSMYAESLKLCEETGEHSKYLMTFQNFLARVPQWNNDMIKKECARIVEKSGCAYLEDLIACVHIAHLKILTTIRTGKTQKKIEIDIPKLEEFIHNVYIHCSRELYENMYLFKKDVEPLLFQQNRKQLNNTINTAILDSVRRSIPVDQLLRAYLDETTDLIFTKEKDEAKEVKEEEEVKSDHVAAAAAGGNKKETITFSDKDNAISIDKQVEIVDAPKNIERLQEISDIRHAAAKAAEKEEEEGDKIKISDLDITDVLDITDINKSTSGGNDSNSLLGDITILS